MTVGLVTFIPEHSKIIPVLSANACKFYTNSNLAAKVTQLSTALVIPFSVGLRQICFNAIFLAKEVIWFSVVPVGELYRTSIRPNVTPFQVSIIKSNPHGRKTIGCVLYDKVLLIHAVGTNQIGSVLLTTLLSLRPA